MKAINDFLLGLFTGNDDIRPKMMFPSLENGIVYATDCHVLIAIPKDELSLKYRTIDKFPSACKVIKDMESNKLSSLKVSVEHLAKELAKCRVIADKMMLKCKECNGTGDVEWEYTDKDLKTHYEIYNCPLCEGRGEFETNNPFARIEILQQEDEDGNFLKIKIGDIHFHPFQLFRLFMVAVTKGCKEINLFYDKNNYGQTITYFGNIKVLVMAMAK